MKSPEQQLREWITDEIVFDGGGMICIFTREEFARLAQALGEGTSDTILKTQRKVERYNPMAVQEDVCFPAGTRFRSFYDAERISVSLPVDQIVDWRLARNFFENRDARQTINAQWLLQFSNLLEAIFAIGNVPEAYLDDTRASFR